MMATVQAAENTVPNLAVTARVEASSVHETFLPKYVNDGIVSNESRWIGASDAGDHLLSLTWEKPRRVGAVRIVTGWLRGGGWCNPIGDFNLQYLAGDDWRDAPGGVIRGNSRIVLTVKLTEAIETTALRLLIHDSGFARIAEVFVYPPSAAYPELELEQSVVAASHPPRSSFVKGSDLQVSGIYPHLAYYNDGGECGTGAVVPWAGRLWIITYSAHSPKGSTDKLYQVDRELNRTTCPESIGGTPANRMIHRESKQLFIGPYAIDADGKVRAIPYANMFGRPTGSARHLFDPANKIYCASMEEGFYEIDVHTLEVRELFADTHLKGDRPRSNLPGCHGKGLYSGQGRLVYSNNGEKGRDALTRPDIPSGCLAEWDGKAEEWTVVRRNQFVEVTGPGGVCGNANAETDPVWATGWDHRSLLLGLRCTPRDLASRERETTGAERPASQPQSDAPAAQGGRGQSGTWRFFRLPKASHSYDGAHGWNTEWPRIRDVGVDGQPDLLMTMHGMFWRFPKTFSAANTAGIRPRSAYLKVVGDFCRWGDRLVIACDDSAQKEFLNKRKAKGGLHGPGQSNSNLWFVEPDTPDRLGPVTAGGAVWLKDPVKAGDVSEPFLFAGWARRGAFVQNAGAAAVTFTFEVDEKGNGSFRELKRLDVSAGKSSWVEFTRGEAGEWIRVRASAACSEASVVFNYSARDDRGTEAPAIFDGLARVSDEKAHGGLLWGLGGNRRRLGVAALDAVGDTATDVGYYELDGELKLVPVESTGGAAAIKQKASIPRDVVTVEPSSVLVVDNAGRRWRLPKGNSAYDALTDAGVLRISREVATERDLFSCHGTFYELPAENADGFAKIRPVASHNLRVMDYASCRGMFVMAGVQPGAGETNPHIVRSEDGKAALWVGAIDDLWRLGRPRGEGGPWKDSAVKAGEVSDPYLFGHYGRRTLTLSHGGDESVAITVELDPTGHGPWMAYKTFEVRAGQSLQHMFPDALSARWIRFSAARGVTATARLVYE